MPSDRQVTVNVKLNAGGNLGQVAKNISNDVKKVMDFSGGGVALGPGRTQFEESNKIKSKESMEKLNSVVGKTIIALGALQAAALGFVAAASPAAFQTFTGSLQLAAGEIGIMLIPAIVKVSGFLQDVAEVLHRFNEVTFGVVGQIAKFIAIPTALVLMGGAIYKAVSWLFGLTGASEFAARGLMKVGIAGGASGSMSAMTGVGGATGGIGVLGRIGIAATGVGVGSAIGGAGGSAISGASIGGLIGSFGGPIATAVGAAVGAGLGLLANALTSREDKMSKMSFNFQAGAMDIGESHDIIQRESLRDPMQQANFEQQTRAIEALAREVGYLSSAVRHTPWQMGT
jgi:hypothetical protein